MTTEHSNLSLAQLTLMIASFRWKLEEPVLRKDEGKVGGSGIGVKWRC